MIFQNRLWKTISFIIVVFGAQVTLGSDVVRCPSDKPLKDWAGKCHACTDVFYVSMRSDNATDCTKLCPNRYYKKDVGCFLVRECSKDAPLYDLIHQTCHPCDTTKDIPAYDCSVCPNRHVDKSGNCVVNECPADRPLKGAHDCYACDIKETIHMDVNSDMTTCTSVCSNRYLNGENCYLKQECPEEAPLYDSAVEKKCYSCDTPRGIYEVLDCSVCPNRHVERGYCVLDECPADNPLRGAGGCYACDEKEKVPLDNASDCRKLCPNRYQNNGWCIIMRECPKETPLLQGEQCFSCDEITNLNEVADCSVCPNRHMENGYCVLNECPADKPLKRIGWGQGCYACNTEEHITHIKDCEKICPNRYQYGDFCFLVKECSKDKPLYNLFSAHCHSCDDPKDLSVPDCSICPNRYIPDDHRVCVLKKCPADKPLESQRGDECFSCDDPKKLDVKNCSVCSNRKRERTMACVGGWPCRYTTPIIGLCILNED